eukprot:CAMPEP_0117044834 /NCGR_PEP_ID=MMETSP0472-20121206/31049_1 /TAXON_ID=693140 ORGANISM="Tiarina fusus, Strain LIS" /NCGR_SAMPLE_ID=MMETSP0472 /ASSEMBLY_ACC=CAM_ASM_000603 /LENGTH=333 /DNA_ID=CAMNT_0004756669 /DNA_START=86 /DNA_END=1087 /DNA_ORIENTATION=+
MSVMLSPMISVTLSPAVSLSSSVTPSVSVSPSISESNTPTPSISESPSPSITPSVSDSITPTPSDSASTTTSATPSRTPSVSISDSITATPTVSRIFPSDSATATATPSSTPSSFLSPSASTSVTFPDNLPIFVQPPGASTGEIIIQLRTIIVNNKNFGTGIAREVQETIAFYMNIPLDAVIVVRISEFDQATVIVCSGEIDEFFNLLNEQSIIFDNTVLDNAYSQFIFWNVPCRDPLDPFELPSYSNGSPLPSSQVTTYEYDFSTFRFPGQNLRSPDSPSSTSRLSPGKYVSSGVNFDDDDNVIVINVNNTDSLEPLLLFTLITAALIAVIF